MPLKMHFVAIVCLICITNAEDLKDFVDLKEFSEPHELLIAQESRQYETIVKPPVRILKPNGVTNSHRPQYNLDSLEADLTAQLDDYFESTSKPPVIKNYKLKMSKENMIRDAVLRALERKDHVGKFAQILPIIRAMSGNQRVALASLVASQVTTPPGRQPLNLSQVRSMFNNNETSDLMLPILLDTANLIRRAIRPGKETREVNYPQTLFQRRSFTEESLDDDIFDTEDQDLSSTTQTVLHKHRNFRTRAQRVSQTSNTMNDKHVQDNNVKGTQSNTDPKNSTTTPHVIVNDNNKTISRGSYSTTESITSNRYDSISRNDNGTMDLTADATNQTLVQDLPIAEKFRSLNRFMDRKGNLIRRGTFMPKISPKTRRTTAEPLTVISRRRPIPARKLPTATDQAKCEMFTNTLCLHTEDYPADAIMSTIRRNKAAAGALLADFKDPGEGAVDGITAAQEAKYTAEHYLVSNRRGDTANRDFASAGEAGFMCPSTVKYARPQRARATSGQWKYIVNTGEHTQTLRLEKCLKPKESCTYLTDNFKSKCVQVYNYHRLLTWDQQNGLHMDIFKVPTCCSCHIEGYSVSFPPLGHRMHETSSEHFPGEDLSSEHGNQAFESVQSSIQRPNLSKTPFSLNKPVSVESFPSSADNQNTIPGSTFNSAKLNDNEDFNNVPSNPIDSYGNTYFPDSFNQATSVRNVKRPVPRNPSGITALESVTLPSYLEPPTPAGPSSFTFSKDSFNKYKVIDSPFKRGPIRPSRRPIRKKISSGPEDLVSSGTSAVGAYDLDSSTDFNEDIDEAEINVNTNFNPRATIAPKLQAVTTERNFTSYIPFDQANLEREETVNGKKVNYNYHPIIDFFVDDEKNQDSIDREDNAQTYAASLESEWKPINRPLVDTKTTNSIGRKKHK
ncbi:neurotrophin 1 isoform X1 [Bicyclus anynana]|uniref:Neurotrophin 1 isoform X1 n=1 Tax=Bicyclus anynana TaxID=110368 RepID=A0A6J1MY56_BICAN|nr:neurotrophin 1 isoform X1 [Bicyclus anynana]